MFSNGDWQLAQEWQFCCLMEFRFRHPDPELIFGLHIVRAISAPGATEIAALPLDGRNLAQHAPPPVRTARSTTLPLLLAGMFASADGHRYKPEGLKFFFSVESDNKAKEGGVRGRG